jgi:hypothetical protein
VTPSRTTPAKEVMTITSLKLPSALLAALRETAAADSTTASEIMRAGTVKELALRRAGAEAT